MYNDSFEQPLPYRVLPTMASNSTDSQSQGDEAGDTTSEPSAPNPVDELERLLDEDPDSASGPEPLIRAVIARVRELEGRLEDKEDLADIMVAQGLYASTGRKEFTPYRDYRERWLNS